MRKIRRNILKNIVGSKKIGATWRELQIKKYGQLAWSLMYFKCVGGTY